jgi:hypothetical protein
MQMLINIIKKWLPLTIAIAGLCGLVYVTVQQSLRMGANDPQIQIAEDTASALAGGASADSLVPSVKVDIASSLASFLMIYDNAGNILASSAMLHGKNPSIPQGVLEYTRQNGEDRVSWQPENDIRIAAVVVRHDNGFVLAGRSLREVEKRISQVESLCGLAMLALWAVTFFVVVLGEVLWHKKSTNSGGILG